MAVNNTVNSTVNNNSGPHSQKFPKNNSIEKRKERISNGLCQLSVKATVTSRPYRSRSVAPKHRRNLHCLYSLYLYSGVRKHRRAGLSRAVRSAAGDSTGAGIAT